METLKILFVDDEPNILSAYKRHIRGEFEVHIASSARAGLEKLEESGPFGVVVSDMQMSGMNGIEFLKEVQIQSPETVRLMLTGKIEEGIAVQAVNESNIFRFLCKPCSSEDLIKAIGDAAVQYRLVTAEKDLLQNTLSGSIKLLTDILSLTQPASFGAALDLRTPIREFANAAGLAQTWSVELAAMLESIGAITLPEHIAQNARNHEQLSPEEEKLLREVPQTSERLIANIPRLKPVAKLIKYVGKNYDGSGLPEDKIAGQTIPIGSRVIRVMKDYMSAKSIHEGDHLRALKHLHGKTGAYDPALLELLERVYGQNDAAKEAATTSRHEVTIQQLCPGQRLLEDVYTIDDVLLITAGNVITDLILTRIINYGGAIGVQEPLVVDSLTPVAE